MRVLLLVIFGSAFGFSACTKEKKSHFAIEGISLLAEGPLTEGSNTAQGTYKDALSSFLQSNNLKVDQISNIRLVKAELSTPDSLDMRLLKSITLQFASDQADMFEAGVVNPVPDGAKSVVLQLPQEAKDLLPTLRQTSFSVVADLDIKQDTSMNFPLFGNFEFKISHR